MHATTSPADVRVAMPCAWLSGFAVRCVACAWAGRQPDCPPRLVRRKMRRSYAQPPWPDAGYGNAAASAQHPGKDCYPPAWERTLCVAADERNSICIHSTWLTRAGPQNITAHSMQAIHFPPNLRALAWVLVRTLCVGGGRAALRGRQKLLFLVEEARRLWGAPANSHAAVNPP